MKLPKGLPNDLVVRTWMEEGDGSDPHMQSSSFVSPLWKHNGDSHPHVVTLNLRPFRTTNLSLDSFMASHSPRRNCGNKQKFMLKPLDLDQRNCSANIHATFGKDALGLSMTSSSKLQNRIPQDRDLIKSDRPRPISSQGTGERKVSASVVTLGDYHGGASKQCVSDSLYNFRNNSFRPSPRLSHATGHKITIGNSLGFNYNQGYMNILQQQTELVATGTPLVTTVTQKQTQTQTKPTLRWQSRSVVNEKNSKYADPMLGASPSFQARMAEITQHELDTVKWEKGKKGKKKNSSSS